MLVSWYRSVQKVPERDLKPFCEGEPGGYTDVIIRHTMIEMDQGNTLKKMHVNRERID